MKLITREESIRHDASCPSCGPQKALFVFEDSKTRYCATCWQELGPRNDIPNPLWTIFKLAKRLGRSAQFAITEVTPVFEDVRNVFHGMEPWTSLQSMSLLMQHRLEPGLKCKIEWFIVPESKQTKKPTDYEGKLRAHASETVCQALAAIVKPLRGEEKYNLDKVNVTQVRFQPGGRCFIRFELSFWFDMKNPTGRSLQIMRGELSWDSAIPAEKR